MTGSIGQSEGAIMATYVQISEYVRQIHGFLPKTGWIAHVKELNGLALAPAPNRKGPDRSFPCPLEKRPAIEDALRHFGIMKAG